jgi:hypothetical protein
MGSLASHPKVPAQTQYVPVYYTALTTPSVPTGQTDTGNEAVPNNEETAARRNANLLERSRGVLSTVLTGFRGVLSQTSTQPRKTLLGE